MARARRLLWLGALAGIVYMLWRWRRQEAERLSLPPGGSLASAGSAPPAFTPLPDQPPSFTPGAISANALDSAPRRIPTRIHRGAPPAAPSAEQAAGPPPSDGPEPAAPAAVTLLAAAVGAEAPTTEIDPPAPEAPPVAAPAAATDLAALVSPEASSGEPRDLAGAVSPDAATGEPLDLAPLVGPDASAPTPIVGLTNLNTADAAALIALPGIGPALARRIIAHRKQHGPFTSIDQLIDIQGIGPKNIDEFRHLVTV